MKRAFLVCALVAVTGLTAWAQSDAGTDAADYKGIPLQLLVEPQSVVNASSGGLFTSAIDDYLGVTAWQNTDVGKGYFFLGGMASPYNENGLIGGYSTNMSAGRLGIFYNGSLLKNDYAPQLGATSYGGNDGAEKADENKKAGQTTWSNNLAVLFGSEAIGGIRFDFQFNPTFKSHEYGKDAGDEKQSEGNGTTITSLTWGKDLGDLKPAITLGFRWPDHTVTESPDAGAKSEKWDNAQFGLKVAVDYLALSADYQMSLDFGETEKIKDGNETIKSGSFDNRLNVGYNLEGTVGEKLTIKAKPVLSLGLYLNSPKTTVKPDSGDTVETFEQPETYFQINPKLSAGAEYAISQKWSLYTGLEISILDVNLKGTSKYKPDKDADEIKATPSAWNIKGLAFDDGAVGPSLGFNFHPAQNISVEFGVDGILRGSFGNYNLNLTSLSGKLAVGVKF